MANQGKHPKNPILEWLEGEESTTPTKSRGAHLVDSFIKKSKLAVKKFRPVAAAAAPTKTDISLLREPGPPRADTKHSQAASWDHQRRLERLSQLRAPYQYKNR